MKNSASLVLVLAISVFAFTALPSFKAGEKAGPAYEKSDTATLPRFGTVVGRDNTYRTLTNRFSVVTDAAGADTVKLYPRAYQTIVKYTAVDSLSFSLTNLTQAFIGDHITFLITSTGSSQKVKFVGSNWQAGSGGLSIALTSGKAATIDFVFNGNDFFETARVVQ